MRQPRIGAETRAPPRGVRLPQQLNRWMRASNGGRVSSTRAKATAACVLVIVALLARASLAAAKDLGDLLVEKGIISQEELQQLRREAQQPAATPPVSAEPATSGPARATAVPAVAAVPSPRGTPEPTAASSLDGLVKNEVGTQLPDWMKHFSIGTLIYMDWAYYFDTGYGPQLLTQITPPGPGNSGFNSFDLTRAYINLFWRPSDRFTIRITPNVFREIDVSSVVNTSRSSQVATNVNGNLSYRLKYGYLQINRLFQDIDTLKDVPGLDEMGAKVGQFENPLIPWQEDLYGYRFVNLVPLNFLAYSSTDLGVGVMGPVTVHGTRYADYWFGFYNGSSFHAAEFNEFRSPQGRVSAYPLAALPGFENLGVSYFMSYGYTNVAPDSHDNVIRRMATLLHYSNRWGGLAFEYDRMRGGNAFGNFFTGAAPPLTVPDPDNPGMTMPNPLATLYMHILNPTAIGEGFDAFGHVNLPRWPVSVFFMWQRWYPNLDVDADPLDFDRLVAGVAWQPLHWMRIAVDSQNIIYLHHGPSVPNATTALFTNLELNY